MEQAYSCTASPKSFCQCLVLLCPGERRKTQQTSPAPLVKGTRPPSRAAGEPQRDSGGFTRGLLGVSSDRQRGAEVLGGSQPCSCSPLENSGLPRGRGCWGPAQPRRWTERAVSRARPFVLQHCDSLC